MLNNLHQQALQSAMSEQPSLSLNFYSFGVTLSKQEDGKQTEYPVDPAQIAVALSAKITFSTGLLSENTLYVHQSGLTKTIVEYRPPQMTGVFLDDSDIPLRIPLPPLVMIRRTRDDLATYNVYAVKKRPQSLDAPLFNPPLPNVFNSGSVCWGSVAMVSDEALADTVLTEDWGRLLGTPFGNHAVSRKSKVYPDDIRQQWVALETNRKRRYTISDLLPLHRTLEQALGGAG